MTRMRHYLIEWSLLFLSFGPLYAQVNKVEMAHQVLHNIAVDGDFATSFSLLEQDGKNVDGWHRQLLDFCTAIYANDSIPDKELAFADRTLEALASSPHSPKPVVVNACYVLGNIAFNARDYHYLDLNINRMKQAAETLAKNRQLDLAIRTLQTRRDIIKEYDQDFKERMQGTWVSAEVGSMLEPLVFLDIMPDSIRRNSSIDNATCYLKVRYDKSGKVIDEHPEFGTKEIVYSADHQQLAAFFGYDKLDKGNPELAVAMAKVGEQWSGAMTRSIAVRNRNNSSVKSSVGMFTSELGGAMMQALAVKLSETVKYTFLKNFYFTEIVPGVVRLDIEQTDIAESSQKGTSKKINFKSLYLYKISPADSLVFVRYAPEKDKQPYVKGHCAYPYGITDIDAYLADRNHEVVDSIQKRPERLDLYSTLSGASSHYKAACYANFYMNVRWIALLQKRLDNIPEALMDVETRRDIQEDLDYRSQYKGVFHEEVDLFDFEDYGSATFKGVYKIEPRYIVFVGIYCKLDKPNELAMMQRGELPSYLPMEKVYKYLRQTIDPIEGTLKWEKKKKHYVYEGQLKDRKFHGQGKLWEDGVLIHEGEFKEGKPVK